MGCIHTTEQSKNTPSNDNNANHHHSRCETSEQPSDLESSPCSHNNSKPTQINTNLSVLSEEEIAITNNKNSTKKIRTHNGSNSLQSFTKQSIISNTATITATTLATIDGTILSHINQNRIVSNYTIDEHAEEEEDMMDTYLDQPHNNNNFSNISCPSSARNSPISSQKQLPLVLQNNTSNTLCLNEDEINEYNEFKHTLQIRKESEPITMKTMKSAPIIAFLNRNRDRAASTNENIKHNKKNSMSNVTNVHKHTRSKYIHKRKPIKRSKSHDPDKEPSISSSNNIKYKGLSVLSKYAYNNSKNAKNKLNTTKSKRKLLHAKSKSIPQNIFTSDLNKYQTEETNNYQYLAQITHFDQNTLRLLHLRFNFIHKMYAFDHNTNSNTNTTQNESVETQDTNTKLDINAMALILGLPKDCILVKRFFGYMDEHKMGQLSFRVFARTMSILSDAGSISEKCQFSFNLYDLNNDGVIDANELKKVVNDLILSAQHCMDPLLVKLIKQNSPSFMDTLIDNTMKLFELDLNGNITYDSYYKFVDKNQRLLKPFTMDIEKLLDFEAEKRRMKRISINSLKKRKLRQMVIGTDPKKKYNKKWKKPQFIKDLEKDKIQHVNSIKNPNDICLDLFDPFMNNINVINDKYALNEVNESQNENSNSNSNDSEMDEMDKKQKDEKLKQERVQRTIDFLYD